MSHMNLRRAKNEIPLKIDFTQFSAPSYAIRPALSPSHSPPT